MKFVKKLFITILLISSLNLNTYNVEGNGAVITVPDDFSNIQAAINSASPGDTIFVRADTYHESISIDKPLNLIGENKETTIIDGLGDYQVVNIDSDNVTVSNFTIRNGNNGLDTMYGDFLTLSNLIVHNTTYDDISLSSSSYCSIINCTTFDSRYGISIYSSLLIEIIGCECFNNTSEGIYCTDTRHLQIVNTSCHDNDNGVYLYYCDVASLCGNSVNENDYHGLDASHCDQMYVSMSSFTGNIKDGANIWYCTGVLANSNLTGNHDDGLESWDSNIKLRYCEMWGNADYEIYSFDSSIDARKCWWGTPSEPVISGGIEYDPWLTSNTHPGVLISDLRCQLSNLDWVVVYPDEKTPKPLGCVAASVSDWLASAFMTTKLESFSEGLDTQSQVLNQSTGELLAESGSGVLTFGGPIVNPIVKRAENNSTPDPDKAPVKWHDESGIFYFQYENGTNIPGAELPVSKINDDEDLFVIERYVDSGGRLITICYGFGWKGTYAAGKYIEFELYPEQAAYTTSWVIVRWQDTNLDGFVNNPGEGDSYTIVATG
jgi:parallel beta-helix repeat protein